MPRLTRLELNDGLATHPFMQDEDECAYLHEYTPGKGYSYSSTNQLITNLKHRPSAIKKKPVLGYHKDNAIKSVARAIVAGLNAQWLAHSTFVPVPPSKADDHPDFDDRMAKILVQVRSVANVKVDCRRLVVQKQSMTADHEAEDRHGIAELVANYEILEKHATPEPKAITIVDDVLTTGRHYQAMKSVLRHRFPDTPLHGIFVARCVWVNDAFDDFESLI